MRQLSMYLLSLSNIQIAMVFAVRFSKSQNSRAVWILYMPSRHYWICLSRFGIDIYLCHILLRSTDSFRLADETQTSVNSFYSPIDDSVIQRLESTQNGPNQIHQFIADRVVVQFHWLDWIESHSLLFCDQQLFCVSRFILLNVYQL